MKQSTRNDLRSIAISVALALLATITLRGLDPAACNDVAPLPELTSFSAADEIPIYSVHAETLPAISAGRVLLVGHHFMIALDPETKLAEWCAYRVTEAEAAGRNQLSRAWLTGLRDWTLEPEDYQGSGYDMGHLAPLASFSSSPYAYELNYVANVAPQRPELNRGPWLALENLVRSLAGESRYVDVIVGPLYQSKLDPLPNADERHRVPSHYWAAIRPAGRSPTGYLVPQSCNRSDSIESFRIEIDKLSTRTGLAF